MCTKERGCGRRSGKKSWKSTVTAVKSLAEAILQFTTKTRSSAKKLGVRVNHGYEINKTKRSEAALPS